ncbi:hypothetical protein C8R46DRAFT_394709 [Mycena filopes]|nr:hypothetical protein C8R46DRAFT_394709 [Mycena filopes]
MNDSPTATGGISSLRRGKRRQLLPQHLPQKLYPIFTGAKPVADSISSPTTYSPYNAARSRSDTPHRRSPSLRTTRSATEMHEAVGWWRMGRTNIDDDVGYQSTLAVFSSLFICADPVWCRRRRWSTAARSGCAKCRPRGQRRRRAPHAPLDLHTRASTVPAAPPNLQRRRSSIQSPSRPPAAPGPRADCNLSSAEGTHVMAKLAATTSPSAARPNAPPTRASRGSAPAVATTPPLTRTAMSS